MSEEPKSIPFPALLERTLGMIEADLSRQANDAIKEAAELLGIDFEDGWRANLDHRAFMKIEPRKSAEDDVAD